MIVIEMSFYFDLSIMGVFLFYRVVNMCAKSPGAPASRLATLMQSDLQISALHDETNLQALYSLYDLAFTSVGPRGRLKVIHNGIGGQVTVTSISSCILSSLNVANPVLRLIQTCTQGHLANHHDGGLFTMIFAIALVKNSLSSNVNKKLLIELNDIILMQALKIMANDLPCKMELDFKSTNNLQTLIQSVLRSKIGCRLFESDVNHLSRLMLQAFLAVYGNEASGQLVYMTQQGLPVAESCVYEGMLFESALSARAWLKAGPQTEISVVIFTMSLSGEAPGSQAAEYEIQCDVLEHLLAEYTAKLEELIKMGVGLLCCQKVVHPRLKAYLRTQNVLTLDRIGIVRIQTLHRLAGGSLLGSMESIRPTDIGRLDIDMVTRQDKLYHHLKSEKNVVTLLLGHSMEETLEELKRTCMHCEQILHMSLEDNRVLAGGGCWQSQLLFALISNIANKAESVKQDLGCSQSQLNTALDSLTTAMKSFLLALDPGKDHMIDTTHHHHWIVPTCNGESDWSATLSCCCHAIVKTKDTNFISLTETKAEDILKRSIRENNEIKRPGIMDSYPAMLNALRTSLTLTNLILGIENVIIDTN